MFLIIPLLHLILTRRLTLDYLCVVGWAISSPNETAKIQYVKPQYWVPACIPLYTWPFRRQPPRPSYASGFVIWITAPMIVIANLRVPIDIQ